jgi:hypothetical protein
MEMSPDTLVTFGDNEVEVTVEPSVTTEQATCSVVTVFLTVFLSAS